MLDYQRIVDDVRGALFNNADVDDDFLQAAAADYSLASDEVNQRLGTCGALLRKGLRSEAIQLCEVEPNLLDAVEILDFPESDSWKELLSLRGLATPVALKLDAAADLNAAYAVEQPLATLLQRHRLLAMSRGPMKHRVETLRSLAEADPENPVWEQDLRGYEEARVKELQREVSQAVAGGDAAALALLSGELERSTWRVEPTDLLIQQIAVARSNAARLQGLGDLRRSAEELAARHAAFDVMGARAARAVWEQLFAAWGQFAGPPLLAQVGPALAWLAEQDELEHMAFRHERAVALMEQALVNKAPAEELHRLHREAKREGDVPEGAEARYRQRLETLDRGARRKLHLTLAAFALFILALAGIFVKMLLDYRSEEKIKACVAKLEQLVEDNKSDEALACIDQLASDSPKIAADGRVQEIRERLTARLKDEDGRRKAFTAALELVNSAIKNELPDDKQLAQARSLAVTAEEKAETDKAKLEYDRIRSQTQSKIDQDFIAQVKELSQRTGEVEKLVELKPDDCLTKLNHIAGELADLERSSPQVSDAARKPAKLLQERLESLNTETQGVNEWLDFEEKLTAACGDTAAFRKALLAYAEKFPLARRSASLRRVAEKEFALWEWLDQWNRMVEATRKQSFAKIGKKAAAEMATKLQSLLGARSGYPDADAFRERLPFLAAVVSRTGSEGNAIESALKPIFTDPLVAGAWTLKDSDGKRYYLLEDPTAKFGPLAGLQAGRIYGFEYVAGFDLSKKRKSLRGSDIKAEDVIAPQRKTGRALAAILDALGDENWEPSFCRMVDTVLKDDDTDPLLRHFLLRKALDTGCQGSLCLEKGFASSRQILKSSSVSPAVNWVDPEGADADAQRPAAEADMTRLARGFSDSQNETAKLWRWLGAPVGREYVCVGWLRKDAAGNWQCRSKTNCPAAGTLVVLRADDDDAKSVRFETVGRINGGKPVVEGAPAPALAEGRPVFTVPPPN